MVSRTRHLHPDTIPMHLSCLPLTAALLALPGADVAAQALPDPSESQEAPVKTLGVVSVSGARPTSLPTQIPTTIEGLTGAQIARTINASDAEDALKYLPSLLVRKRYIGDYNHAVLSTRASGTGNSARSMVYADGILLSNYLGNGATFAPRWAMVMPEEIARVDVLYGPFSAAYPGNSAGAVVDYVTRMPTAFESHAKVSLTTAPFALYHTSQTGMAQALSASVGNKSGDWSWLVALHHTDSDAQPLTFATRVLSTGVPGAPGMAVSGAVTGQNRLGQDWAILGTGTQYDTLQDHLRIKLAYDVSPTLRASYTLGYWHNTASGRAASYLQNVSGTPVYSGAVTINGLGYTLVPADFPASRESLDHVMQGLSLKSANRGIWDWEVATSVYDYRHDILRAPTVAYPAAATGGTGHLIDQSGTGWNTLAIKAIWRPQGMQGNHVVDFGYARDAYHLASLDLATARWIDGAPAAPNLAFGGKTTLNSVYAQDTWKLAARWKTVLGARLENWRATDGLSANAQSTVFQAGRSNTAVSPKAALAFQASADWTLKASLGRAVRMPTVSELYQGGVNSAGMLINNDPTLQPEKSWTTELTAEGDLGPGVLRLTGFAERTVDALYSQTNVLVTPNVTNIQNIDRISTRGLEASYSATNIALRGLDLNTSMTWTDSRISRNDKFPTSVGKLQPRIPVWRATAVATWRASERWATTLGARYSGTQFSTLDNSDANGFAYQGTSTYFTVDTRVTYQISRQWSAAIGIDNLNNANYWNFHPYPQRTYSAELRFDL